MCAFGGTKLLRQKRLREDKTDRQKGQDELTAVNAFGTTAFGTASSAMHLRRIRLQEVRLWRWESTPSALQELSECGARRGITSAGKKLRHSGGEFAQCNFKNAMSKATQLRDDFAEASADWAACFPAQADYGEARFPLMGVELRVPGHVDNLAEAGFSHAATPGPSPGTPNSIPTKGSRASRPSAHLEMLAI
ncbi:hypothetical protein AXG93_2683s1010 [Marchantia polymorpha subsp. ruderalis]|uniref:Uncharacterized protein n=1 Tax=Marchantia polymorpha subsp. ruderalis TaxID=1480154 RepID=A0A176W8P7_MARPO|nr:hypothetical protein AXG93_2683s1010 [Marchantia polymorpha subsp. ruderalis]